MYARKSRKTGFTLVEILIVVVILGILAAIVIPQFTNASESAKASSLVTQLQSIRSQLELYQVQHNGAYPDLVNSDPQWEQFTQYTNTDGDVSATKDVDAGFKWGPYMQQPPANGFQNGSTTVVALTATPGASDAWCYDMDTGTIKAAISTAIATKVDMLGRDDDFIYY